MLDLKKIEALSTSAAVFQRAKQYVHSHRIGGLKIAEFDDILEVTAIVRGSELYVVRLELDRYDQSFRNASCDCPAFHQYPGLCKHAAAVLLSFFGLVDSHNVAKSSGEHQKNTSSIENRSTNREGRVLMNLYQRMDATKAVQELAEEEAPVHLQPILDVAYGAASLRLRVGRRRMYVIQDFSELYDSMCHGRQIAYGQQFTWLHTLESIQEEDRPLMRLLMEYCGAIAAWENSYEHAHIGPALPLSERMLDRLMQLLLETRGEVLFRDDASRSKGRLLIQDTPRLTAHMEQNRYGDVRLHLPAQNAVCGEKFIYFIEEKHILMSDSACRESLAPILRAFGGREADLIIAKHDLPEFFSTIYHSLEPYMAFTGDTHLAEEYLPLPLRCRLELDAPEPDKITCRVLFQYGDECLNPLEDAAAPALRRNHREETRKLLQLDKVFHLRYRNHFVFSGNDEEIYEFLTGRLQTLEQIGEPYISDRLKRMMSVPATHVSASVSLDVDLLHLKIGVDGFPLDELYEVLDAYRLRRQFYRLRSGQFLSLKDDALETLAELSETLELNALELKEGTLALPKHRALYLDHILRRRESTHYERNERFKALIRTVRNVEDSDFAVPESLRRVLRNYQKTGYRWMRTLCEAGFHGVLADDMGLGKTLQVITLLLSHKERMGQVRALVVCPASLVLNWKAEVDRFAPGLHAQALTGAAATRHEQLASGQYDILITSYDQLKRDIACYEDLTFDYEILDEAQTIKNAHTLAAKAAKAITATHRFALTGTPVENRLSELWSIFDFLMPGYLFTYKRFKERYELPAVKQQDEEALARVQRLAAPFVLRRMKRDVLKELPDKVEAVRFAELDGEQKKLYLAHALNIKNEIARSIEGNMLEPNKLKILALLTRLRQICCDPGLFVEEYRGESAKLELCLELVDEAIDSGHRVLLFSQFTSMLDIIRARLEQGGIASYTLQGSTGKLQRQQLVDSFQSGEGADVFLISLRAGGLGLNLTGADVVILYDPWWNTAAENQAADRAYRMGQTRNVQVIRLIAKDTIEERILELQQVKRDLADSVITEGNALQSLTEQDWMRLLD